MGCRAFACRCGCARVPRFRGWCRVLSGRRVGLVLFRWVLALAALLGSHAILGPVFTTPTVCAYLAEAGAPAASPEGA